MKKRSLTKNLIYNTAYQLIVTAVPLITTPFTARMLGVHSNGIHSFAESVVMWFCLTAALGTSVYGARSVAYCGGDVSRQKQTVFEIMLLRMLLSAAAICVYVPLYCINGEFVLIFRLQIINIIANMIDLTWYYQGIEDFRSVALRNGAVKLAYVVLLFALIRLPSDLPKYVLIIVGSSLAANVVMALDVLHRLKSVPLNGRLRPFSHIKASFGLFVPQIMSVLYAIFDRTMLGYMTATTDNVTIYDQGQRLILALAGILQSASMVMMVRVAGLSADNDEGSVRKHVESSVGYTLLLAVPMCFGLLGTANELIPIFLGGEYVRSTAVLKLLAPLVITMPLNSILGYQLLIPTGNEKSFTVGACIGAGVNVLINLFLLKSLTYIGACISSIAAELAVIAVLGAYSSGMLSLVRTAAKSARAFLAGAIMFGCVCAVDLAGLPQAAALCAKIAVGITVYFAAAFALREPYFMSIIKMLKRK